MYMYEVPLISNNKKRIECEKGFSSIKEEGEQFRIKLNLSFKSFSIAFTK